MTDMLTSTNGVHDDPEPIRIEEKRPGRPINSATGRVRDRLLNGERLSKDDVSDQKALANAVQGLRSRGTYVVGTERSDNGTTIYSVTAAGNPEAEPPATPPPPPANAKTRAKAKPRKARTLASDAAKRRAKAERYQEATVGDLLLGDRLQVTQMSLDAGVRRITLIGERGMVLRFSAEDPS